jgi:pimeloyl-ACP methyl ester carboxylesterase
MLNRYSPAQDAGLEAVAFVTAPRVRYPSPPPALRWLRFQLGVLQKAAPGLAFRLAWRLFGTPRRLPLKAWEEEALAEARRRAVAAPSGPVAVYEWGPATAPAVVLVHGWEHRASFWRAWVGPLLAVGYRVVALDGPGHGANPARQVNLVQFGEAAQAVVSDVALTSAVQAIVAHSFGAASVAGLPVALPAGAPLPRLVLLSVPVNVREVANRFADLLHLRPELVARMERHIHTITGRPAASFAAATAGPGTRAERVLIIHDEGDEIVPFQEGRQVAAAWPGAVLKPTRGLGHNRILRDAEVVREAVAFIGA